MNTFIRGSVVVLGSWVVSTVGFSPTGGFQASASSIIADLSLVVIDEDPFPQCHAPGEQIDVQIQLGITSVAVVGGQFLIQYDPSCLDFVSVQPGMTCDPLSPFESSIFLEIDEEAGQVFYAVGVAPNSAGAPGPLTLACLSFTTLAECAECSLCFGNEGNQTTRISDRLGNPVPFTPHCSGPLSTIPDVAVECPGNMVVQATCEEPTVVVNWSMPHITDGCLGDLKLTCAGMHKDGTDLTDLALGGGTLSPGVSTFCCRADTSCEGLEACCWTVTVEAGRAECDDGNDCTDDVCDADYPGAGPDGCVHEGLYKPNGDIVPPGGDGIVAVDDVLCVLDAFVLLELCPQGDLYPCGGDGVVEVLDILAVLDAFIFSGVNECPCPE